MADASDENHESALAEARSRLEKFERSATSRELMARLRAASPMHPFLVFRTLGGLGALVCGSGAIAVLLLPLFSRDLAVQLAGLDDAAGVPMPFVLALLAGCALATMAAAHVAALSAARSAALQPHEAKIHSRLVSEIKQIEAQRAVKERMTPRPASPRLLAR
jgi:hypothetical protein